MRVAVLTSSRADYGIYLPLLKAMKADDFFDLKIIAFGTHLSRFHGYTVEQIERDGFEVNERVESLILGDTAEAISNAIGNTITKFSSIWQKLQQDIDLIITLGDRYEMFAAAAAAVPFNLKVAHLHGGETTLGAIDNIFRHAITLMSSIHFVSTAEYAKKVAELTGLTKHIYNIGALSLDNLSNFSLYNQNEFEEKFQIDLSIPTILTTFHPETVSIEKNETYTNILVEVFGKLATRYQIVITMPNADTMGSMIRVKFNELVKQNKRVIAVENFGSLGYFSCMKYCAFLLGNTSSGIIEAASFGKYVINLGERQKGRANGLNVLHTPIAVNRILENVTKIEEEDNEYSGENIYRKEGSANQIIQALKKLE